jgi:very-short-patch-repair endonuclease
MIADHDGVFTSAQARGNGVSDDQIQRRVTSGEWVRVARGVFRVANRKVDLRMRMRIAVLRVGPGAVLAGMAAAWWHGLTTTAPSVIVVIAPPTRHGSRIPGCRVWHRKADPADVTSKDSLAVTTIALTVLDGAVDVGVRVMDSALLRKQVTLAELIAAQRRNAGRRGSKRARAMLAAMEHGARSEAERKAVALLQTSEIGGWIANHPVGKYVLDLALPEHMIDIEIDGFAHHSDADAFQHDRERQNDLIALGWTVLRFTWHDLTDRPDWVLGQIRAAIRQATAA